MSKKVLVIDDIQVIRDLFKLVLPSKGYTVLLAETGDEALKVIKEKGQIDLVFVDLKMPGKTGDIICAEIKKNNPEIPVIAMTAFGREVEELKDNILKAGAIKCLDKPFDIAQIIDETAAAIGEA